MAIPNATITTLDNGLRVVCEEIPYLRSVSMGLVVGSGASSEEKDVMGISHFIEHMTFKGTNKRNAFQIVEELDNIGGKLNAFTGKEYTVFYSVVQDKHFPIAADVLSDILLNSVYKDEDVNLEKNVVLEEIKMYEDTPDEQIHDLFATTIFPEHKIGNSVLGKENTVKAFSREKILSYMKDHYTPDNLIVSVAGNIKTEEVVRTLSSAFSNYNGKAKPISNGIPLIKHDMKLKKKKTEQIHLVIGTKGIPNTSDDRYILTMIDNVMGGSMSSRLFQEIREKNALCYSIYSFSQGYKDIGVFEVYCGVSKENLEKVTGLIMKEYSDIKNNGLKPEELFRAKESIKGSLVIGLESSNSRMNYIAKSLYHHKRVIPIDEIIEKIDKVTNDDILRITDECFREELLNMVIIGDIDEMPIKRLSL